MQDGVVVPNVETLEKCFRDANWSVASLLAGTDFVIIETPFSARGELTSFLNGDRVNAMSNAMARYIVDEVERELVSLGAR